MPTSRPAAANWPSSSKNDHGRPPTPVEALHLAQQATLETRDAKHEPRSLAEQRATWLNEAATVLGGHGAVTSMVQTALAPPAETATIADARWVAQTADHILAVMEASRSTWQMWHVRAEAQRQVRTIDVPAEHAASALVDLLVDEVLDRRSVALAAPADNIEEPEALRRVDGSSVYTVAGADLYTSQRILDAEPDSSPRRDAATVRPSSRRRSTWPCWRWRRTALHSMLGRRHWSARCAPRGHGCSSRSPPPAPGRPPPCAPSRWPGPKTAARCSAWPRRLPRPPSSREQTGIRTDTLAKLTWSLDHGDLPDWAAAVGPSTLVIIDEAGMADTLSLDTAVQFVIGRGASVRLVGDDQQLAAIGAGGVLRDIATHPRRAPADRAAPLHRPRRSGSITRAPRRRPRALDFYLDQAASMSATSPPPPRMRSPLGFPTERRAGRDHARPHPATSSPNSTAAPATTVSTTPPDPSEVHLADGNLASAGDVIITRSNDRRLRLTATDWVKNGDRWTVTHVGRHGDLTVRHTRSRADGPAARRLRPRLDRSRLCHHHPYRPRRLRRHHARPATGQESRQQLYTMLTRGRHANHLYLQVVGDGDPHSLIRPDTISPRTPTETLQQILARDEAPVSASTLLRELNNPAARLFQAVQRYTDGLHVAAEQLLGPKTVAELDQADQYIPGLTTEPAWPTLRAHLLALAAETGEHPLRLMLTAARGRDLQTAGDMAAVLYWRLPELTPTNPGPLPWLPGIPPTLQHHPVWGGYLAKRSQLVADLADQVQDHACQGDGQPVWAPSGSHPSTALIGEIAVWRAANGINPQDPRPTGGAQLQTLPALWKQRLDRDIARATYPPANARADERQAGRTAPSPGDDRQRPYQRPERRPSRPPAPSR